MPYAKCVECVESGKLKCENCLEDIVRRLKVLTAKSEESQRMVMMKARKKRYPQVAKPVYEIRKSYEMYMEQQSLKKKLSPSPNKSSMFPTKKVRYTLTPAPEPRFEKWKARSLLRIK